MWLFGFFFNSANLICRGTDISKYFRESLGLRDNESRLFIPFREYDEVDTVLSTSFDGNSYNHDVCIIKKSTSVLEGGAKTLQKLQKSISQKKRNENKCKEDYVTCLSKMRQELQTITDVSTV